MRMSQLDIVLDYLEDYAGRHHTDLTYKKVNERGSWLSGDAESGEIHFKVERHHSIIGAKYITGLPMAAYATYNQSYCFITDTKELYEEGQKEYEPLDIKTISYSSLAVDIVGDSYYIEELESGAFSFTSYISGELVAKENVEAVREAARSILKNIPLECELEEIEDLEREGVIESSDSRRVKKFLQEAVHEYVDVLVENTEVRTC